MNIVLKYLYTWLVLLSCHSATSTVQEEYLQMRHTNYRVVNNEPLVQLSFLDNVWYQDSVGITQLSGIGVYDTPNRDSLYQVPLGYRFVDMRKNWVYEYRNLSDTAEIVLKFAKADSVGLMGGWGFFRRSAIKFDSLTLTGDSTINGIVYRKYQFIQDFAGNKLLSKALARCDRKGTIFHLDVGLSNAAGCPIVSGTSMRSDDRSKPSSAVEIAFISNVLPDSVRRVFAAWKRNVELYPVR